MTIIKGLFITFICAMVEIILGGVCLCIPQIVPLGEILIITGAVCAVVTSMTLLAFVCKSVKED